MRRQVSRGARSPSAPSPSANAARQHDTPSFPRREIAQRGTKQVGIGESLIDVDAPSHSAASRYSRKSGVTSLARRPSPSRLASLHRRRAQSAELEQVHLLAEQKSRVDVVDDDGNAGEVFNQVLLDSSTSWPCRPCRTVMPRAMASNCPGARDRLIQALARQQPILAAAPAVGTDEDLLVITRARRGPWRGSPPRRRRRSSRPWRTASIMAAKYSASCSARSARSSAIRAAPPAPPSAPAMTETGAAASGRTMLSLGIAEFLAVLVISRSTSRGLFSACCREFDKDERQASISSQRGSSRTAQARSSLLRKWNPVPLRKSLIARI